MALTRYGRHSVTMKAGMMSLLLLAVMVTSAARAHDVPPSIVLLDIGRNTIDVELHLPFNEFVAALSQGVSLQSEEALSHDGPLIEGYLRQKLHFRGRDGRDFALQAWSQAIEHTNNVNWISNSWLVVHCTAVAPPGASTEDFRIDYSVIIHRVVSHQALIYVRRDIRNALMGDQPQLIGVLGFEKQYLNVDGTGGSWWRGFTHLFSLGMQHIAEGTDHLLFLLVLLLPASLSVASRRWCGHKPARATIWSVARIVTGFTLGHSITLAVASAGWVSVPSRPIEVLIAVSIIVSSAHAVRPLFPGREIWVASAFGLVHGLAFATNLAGLRFDGATLAVGLLGFNLGIEAMQLLVIAAVLPPLLLLSTTRIYNPVRITGAAFAALCSIGWIVERAFLRPNPFEPVVSWLANPPSWLGPCALGASLCCCLLMALTRDPARLDRPGLVEPRREPWFP